MKPTLFRAAFTTFLVHLTGSQINRFRKGTLHLISLGLVLLAGAMLPSARAAGFFPSATEPVTAGRGTLSTSPQESELAAQALAQGLNYVQVDDMRFRIDGIGVLSSFAGTRWTDGKVYYTFADTVTETNRQRFRTAVAEWAAVASLEFIEGTGNGNYIHVVEEGANWSYIGMCGEQQELSIFNWTSKFVIVHEMGHALGLLHEQSRSDRDSYVIINWQNILMNKEGNFYKTLNSDNYGAYDFDSVMHYDQYAFSTNGLPTIQTLPAYSQYQNTIGQLSHLSSLDQMGMQLRYPYPEPPPPPTNVTASVDSSHIHIRLTWSATQALGYLIYRHTVSNATGASLIATTEGSPFFDSTAIAGTNYYYWVAATNLAGASGLSPTARGRRNLPAIPAPANLTASRGDYLDHVHITYDPVPGATHYQITRWPGGVSAANQVPITGWMEGTTTFDDYTAKPVNYYYYAVYAAASEDALGLSAPASGVRGYVTPSNLASDVSVPLTSPTPFSARIGNEAGCSWWWAAAARCLNPDDFVVASINTNLSFEGHATAESGYDSEYGLKVKLVVANGVALGSTPCNFFVSGVHRTAEQTAEFEGTGETLTPGQNPAAGAFDWPAGDVVEMWDVALSPGSYTITLHPLSGAPDFDLALFAPTQRFASRSEAAASAAASGEGGDETLSFRVSQAGVYGLCVLANTTNAATFTLAIDDLPFVWQGTLSTSWHFATNWVNGLVPHAAADVIIPSSAVRMPSVVSEYHAYCRALTIEPGASLTVSGGGASNRWLHTSGDLTVRGTLSLPDASSRVECQGKVLWQSGSLLSAAAGAEIAVSGDWEAETGADVSLAGGRVVFQGSLSSILINHTALCAFGALACEKSAGRRLAFSSASSKPLEVGELIILTNTTFVSASTQPVNISRAIDNRGGHLSFLHGACVFTGEPSLPLALNTGDTLNDLTLRGGGTLTLSPAYTNTFTLTGDITLQDGLLAANGVDLRIGGNWDNRCGLAGFAAHTNTVAFVGATGAIYGTNTFHQLRDETTTNTLAVAGQVVVENTCVVTRHLRVYDSLTVEGLLDLNATNAVLDVPAGGAVVAGGFDMGGTLTISGGSFTCEDIVDAGLDGTVNLPGGTATLGQGTLASDRFDLLGNIVVAGGILQLSGGSPAFPSLWPNNQAASLTLQGGAIEVLSSDISIRNAPGVDWSCTMTGGSLRLGGDLAIQRGDFTPSFGTVEFYGTGNAALSVAAGSWLPTFACNKSGGSTLSATSELRIRGDVNLLGGAFAAPALLSVEGGWSNAVGNAGFTEGSGTVRFSGSPLAKLATDETFFNLIVDKNNSDQSAFLVASGRTVTVLGDLSLVKGTVELDPATVLAVAGDLSLTVGAALNADDLSQPTPIEIRVGGDWLNDSAGYSAEYGFNPGYSSRVIFTGSASAGRLVNASRESFYELVLNRPGGSLTLETPLTVRGALTLQSGTLQQSTAYSHRLLADLTVSGTASWAATPGTLAFEGRSAQVSYTSPNGALCDLLVDKMPGQTLSPSSDIPMAAEAAITVRGGLFDLGSHLIGCSGDVTVEDGGTLQLGAGATCTIGDGHKLNVESGGRMNLFGAPGNPACLAKASGSYSLTIRDGGQLAAMHASFSHMNDDGLLLGAGSLLVEPYTLHNCSFMSGYEGGTLLHLLNNQTFTVRQARFEATSNGPASNVRKSSGSGRVDFIAASGPFSGEAYDEDLNNLVDWHSGELADISLKAPGFATRGGSLNLTATVSGEFPLTPITYRWSVTDNADTENTHHELTDTRTACLWNSIGSKSIYVSASNELGFVKVQQDIEVAVLACDIIGRHWVGTTNAVDLVILGTGAGATYRIEYRKSLSSGGWQPAAPDGTAVSGEDKQTPWTDLGGPDRDITSEPKLFYRAVLTQP